MSSSSLEGDTNVSAPRPMEYLDLKADQYRRLLDSLVRFYNSQITAHVGYLITSIVLFFAFFALAREWLSALFNALYLPNAPLSFLAFTVFAACYFLLPYWLPYRYMLSKSRVRQVIIIFPVFLFARLQYYIALSEVVWQHMGINLQTQTRFDALKERATLVVEREKGTTFQSLGAMGIQTAVIRMFEAQLYLTMIDRDINCEQLTEDDEKILSLFDFNSFYHSRHNLSNYKKARILFMSQERLLLLAYSKTILEYCNVPEGRPENRIGQLFKDSMRNKGH